MGEEALVNSRIHAGVLDGEMCSELSLGKDSAILVCIGFGTLQCVDCRFSNCIPENCPISQDDWIDEEEPELEEKDEDKSGS